MITTACMNPPSRFSVELVPTVCRSVCAGCHCEVYDSYDEYGDQSGVESRWRHVEHLLLACPAAVPSCHSELPVDLLRADLLQAAEDDPAVRAAVLEAFPPGVLDTECRAAVAVPFLLDPVRALCGHGPVRGRVVHDCVRLVAMFVLGVACSVCGEPACGVARSALPSLSVPFPSRVRRLLPPVRSAAQDSRLASCDLLDGVCVCDQSALGAAPQGAQADAREGRA